MCSSAPPPAPVMCYYPLSPLGFAFSTLSLHGVLSFSLHMFSNLHYMALKIVVGVYVSFCQKECQHLANETHMCSSFYSIIQKVEWCACIWHSVWCLRWWRFCFQCERPGFDPWVREILWRGEWQPTPVLLPGKLHGQRSLLDNSPWGHKDSETTGWLTTTTLYFVIFCGRIFYLIV